HPTPRRAAPLASVPPLLPRTTTATSRFFERRLSLMTRAFGSPKIPHTVGSGRKPGKQYASQSRRLCFARLAIHLVCRLLLEKKKKNTNKHTQSLHYYYTSVI